MTFQFMCPQGHLIQAAVEHAGQHSTCPVCGTAMVIPHANVEAAAVIPTPDATPAIVPADATAAVSMDAPLPDVTAQPEVFHIPCPNGHPLETPLDMLGQFAKCPHCDAQFELLEENSEEFKRRKRAELEAHTANLDRKWLNRSIAVVMLVVLVLVGLAIASYLNR